MPTTDDSVADHTRAIQQAIAVLQAGGVVAIPTDTVYGIAASLGHPAAIERLFSIKGRESSKAIPVLVDSVAALTQLAASVPEDAERLAAAFWPGGLTIIVQAGASIPAAVLRGGTTVGLRMPDNADALAVIGGAGGALAVTSANRSGDTEAHSAEEVRLALGTSVDFVLDGGDCGQGVASTVVDATRRPLQILRFGAISPDLLRTFVVVGTS